MKVLGLVCSPRKEGNTEILVSQALASAKESGAETELLHVADMNIAPCDACGACAAQWCRVAVRKSLTAGRAVRALGPMVPLHAPLFRLGSKRG